MATVRAWAIRLEALAGVLPGEVSESAEAYFRMMGAVFVALAIVMVILARVVGFVYLRPVILPAIGQVIPTHTTSSTVVKVLPPSRYSPPGFPYGFWDSRGDKSFFAGNPHVHVGETVTMSWGYGNYLRHIIVGGRFFDVRVVIPLPLELSVLLVGGTWLLAVLLALLCLRNARRIHLDRQVAPHMRSLTVEQAWCPWPEAQISATIAPLAYPILARDDSGHRFTLAVPATVRPAPTPGSRLEVACYPRTGALDPPSIQLLAGSAREPNAARPLQPSVLWRLLCRLNVATVSSQAQILWRFLTGVRLLSTAIAVFGLYIAWITLPATVPDWFPISVSHPTVTRVYTPYTFEQAYYPYEIAASDGHLYWFAHSPHLKTGDTLTVRRDAIGGFLSMSHGGFAGSAGRHDQPVDVLILVGVSLAGLWRFRRWSTPWEISTAAVSERVTLARGLASLQVGYPITVRAVSSGRTFPLHIAPTAALDAERLLRAAGHREFTVTYHPHSHAAVRIDVPEVGSLEVPQATRDDQQNPLVEEVTLIRGLLARGAAIPFLDYTILVRSTATDEVRYLRVPGRHVRQVAEFLASTDERRGPFRVAYHSRRCTLLWLDAPGMERLQIAPPAPDRLDDRVPLPVRPD